jgi:hypothetical protein
VRPSNIATIDEVRYEFADTKSIALTIALAFAVQTKSSALK